MLRINEVSSNTKPDWVELFYSPDATISANLSEYKLVDSVGGVKALSGELAAGSFITFDWSNRLNNDGDSIELIEIATGLVLDHLEYGQDQKLCAPLPEQSLGRVPDGVGEFRLFFNGSKSVANGDKTIICPVNTATIEPSNVSTSTPSPTIVITSSPNSSSVEKIAIQKYESPSAKVLAETNTVEDLEESSNVVIETPTPTEIVATVAASVSSKSASLLPTASIVIGVIIILAIVYPVFRNRLNQYNKTHGSNFEKD